jgi:hypothetical protein
LSKLVGEEARAVQRGRPDCGYEAAEKLPAGDGEFISRHA